MMTSNSTSAIVLASIFVVVVVLATTVAQSFQLQSSSWNYDTSLLTPTRTKSTTTNSKHNHNSIIMAMMALNHDDDGILLDQVLEVAIDASKKAGGIIIGNEGGAAISERKANSRDLLTLVDPLCEKTIKETVIASFPDHDFLGEEDVAPGKEASAAALDAKLSSGSQDSFLWIVDPIDGTTNFANGMPLCMPSVAVAYNGEVVVGVIFDPHRNELFTAIKGRGAQMNGKTIHVGEQTEMMGAVVAMGSPPGEESIEMSLKGIQALMPKVRTIRMLGSAAIMLAWVANGRLTCYWEYDLSSWDIAAGALVIKEAGGKFTDLEGNDFNLRNRKIMASNGHPNIHEGILKVLRDEAGII